jgi:hypothetical protein
MILAKMVKTTKKETGLAAGTFAVAFVMHQKGVENKWRSTSEAIIQSSHS